MAKQAKVTTTKVDQTYLGSFRITLTDNVLTVIKSYRRIEDRLRNLKFEDCCRLLERGLVASGKTHWRYLQFFAAKEIRGKVEIPMEMTEREFELFVENNQSLRIEVIKDAYGLDMIRLYRR
jgi:hypothetical protein